MTESKRPDYSSNDLRDIEKILGGLPSENPMRSLLARGRQMIFNKSFIYRTTCFTCVCVLAGSSYDNWKADQDLNEKTNNMISQVQPVSSHLDELGTYEDLDRQIYENRRDRAIREVLANALKTELKEEDTNWSLRHNLNGTFFIGSITGLILSTAYRLLWWGDSKKKCAL